MTLQKRKAPGTAGRKSPGRKPLPASQRQTDMIRERVREDVKKDYSDLGGKAFLLEAISMAKRSLRAGRKVIATVTRHNEQGKMVDTVKVDVTACILMMGQHRALEVIDQYPRTLYDISHSEALAKLRSEWKGALVIQVEQSIKDYFA